MKNIPFNSKETYLAYRSTSKAEYKTLSADIRMLRLADRFHQRRQFAQLALSAAEERCLADAAKLCGAGSFDSSLAEAQLRSRLDSHEAAIVDVLQHPPS